MNSPSIISIGPLNLPLTILYAVLAYLVAYVTGRIILRGDSERSRLFSDLLSSPLLPFLLTWKLSIVLTDFQDVISDPLLILYATGGTWNIALAAFAGLGWMTFRWWKTGTGRKLTIALGIALSAAAIAGGLIWGVTFFSDKTRSESVLLPEVPLERPEGGIWTPSEDIGHPVVLNFWASWCPPCRAEMPMLDRLASEDRYAEVAFYAVNATTTEKSKDTGASWLRENGYSIPLLMDSEGQASSAYFISSLPTTIILDSNGRIVEMKSGAVSRSWITTALRKAERSRLDG